MANRGIKKLSGASLAVQWLRLHTANAGGMHLIPGRGTGIPQATQCGQKIKQQQQIYVSVCVCVCVWNKLERNICNTDNKNFFLKLKKFLKNYQNFGRRGKKEIEEG